LGGGGWGDLRENAHHIHHNDNIYVVLLGCSLSVR